MAVVEVRRERDAVTVIELDDPGRYNALTNAMVAELTAAFVALRRDRETRVIVLTGRGRGFCAGANMTGDDEPPADARDRGRVGFIHVLQENLAGARLRIRFLRVNERHHSVAVAAVHGRASTRSGP